MNEFVAIKDFPGYFVSREGQIASIRKGFFQQRKLCVNTHGYLYLSLQKDGKMHSKPVHRLVAETFAPQVPGKPYVNHRNGDQKDNRVCNLEWVTNSENLLHATRVLGRKMGGAQKYSREEALSLLRTGLNQREVAKKLGVHESCISRLRGSY